MAHCPVCGEVSNGATTILMTKTCGATWEKGMHTERSGARYRGTRDFRGRFNLGTCQCRNPSHLPNICSQ